jgi:hypothetical protein
MSKLLTISKEEKEKILELHSKEKKSFVNEQKTQKTREQALAFFKNAKDKGCLTDPNLKIDDPWGADDDIRVFIKGVSKKGNTKRVYDDYTWEIVDPNDVQINAGKWSCVEGKLSSNDPKDGSKVTLPGDNQEDKTGDNQDGKKKKSELTKTIEKGLEGINPTTLKDLADQAKEAIDESFTLEACENFISIYFTQAQEGLYTDNLANRKKSIYACFNKYQAKLSNNTRDQLRWLSGNQEGAKTFGVFKRYKNIGTINDNKERSMFRLDRNFK